MILNKLDSALGFHQDALRIRAKRQEIIAANIANADTPHYKARDVDFKSAMQAATKQSASGGLSTSKTSEKHLSGLATSNSGGVGEPLFRPIIQGSVDGNTVDMDIERNEFADNAIRYQASLQMLNGQIKKMLTAIQGQ